MAELGILAGLAFKSAVGAAGATGAAVGGGLKAAAITAGTTAAVSAGARALTRPGRGGGGAALPDGSQQTQRRQEPTRLEPLDRLRRTSLIATGPQGILSAPNTGRARLLGN